MGRLHRVPGRGEGGQPAERTVQGSLWVRPPAEWLGRARGRLPPENPDKLFDLHRRITNMNWIPLETMNEYVFAMARIVVHRGSHMIEWPIWSCGLERELQMNSTLEY